jgi:hypothetical protein
MNKQTFQIGESNARLDKSKVQGNIVMMDGEQWYCISNYQQMAPFLMSIVSASDLWLFISSSGGLTAGRRSPDTALFPYYTDDKIHDAAATTGSRTTLFVEKEGVTYRWEPFSAADDEHYTIQNNIYKNQAGSKVCFETINRDLELCFRVCWSSCKQFGVVRSASISNLGENSLSIELLDGIVNILPAGVDRKLQNELSALLDGYKKNERISESTLALYTLSSLLTDKAEPAESLKATVVWSAGLKAEAMLLSERQMGAFRRGGEILNEEEALGQRGAYLLHSEIILKGDGTKLWHIAADLNYDHSQAAELLTLLKTEPAIDDLLAESIERCSQALELKIGKADGFQASEDLITVFRHSSVTLFNIMRGGLFENGSEFSKVNFISHLRQANAVLAKELADELKHLPESCHLPKLFHLRGGQNSDLTRLVYEFLPLSFSRRHGDPSRPWNDFAIESKDAGNEEAYHYQGNWRDIFQNWEALALSYPEYVEHFIVKFLNASTADGYNPYRLTENGFDWEAPEPDAPWSNIGYWGDHQIVYLSRLLKLSLHFHPGKLSHLINEQLFVYADIPYRIAPYEALVKDPHQTIAFDEEKDARLRKQMAELGSDGALLRNGKGGLQKASLAEKLLLPLLVKLSNFIPEAGIWMNTQRPEWNDANNALVGYGVSVVTTAHLRPYMLLLLEMLDSLQNEAFVINEDIFQFYQSLAETFTKREKHLPMPISDEDRKSITDALGMAGSDYRQKLYAPGLSPNSSLLQAGELKEFLNTALRFVNHTLSANRRDDLLYHSYNLISFRENGIAIRRLYEMLEGQVAVLDSGFLSIPETISLLDSLRQSALYRPDQDSYLLYPERRLERFIEKNTIPDVLAKNSPLLQSLIAKGKIAKKDCNGKVHFEAGLSNSRKLEQALQEICPDASADEKDQLLNIYETVFDHQSFTGRSGTFYKYEGLGSVYWHMVAKLQLAVAESFYRAVELKADKRILNRLREQYYAIQAGIGSHKNPAEHGAFPTDPYSHTPKNSGAQQPGMTGLTKEELLSRFSELGVRILKGKITFQPVLLRRNELLTQSRLFQFIDLNGEKAELRIPAKRLVFTLGQTPIILIPSRKESLLITMKDGSRQIIDGNELDEALSRSIFRREGRIRSIEVHCLIPNEKQMYKDNQNRRL